MASTVETKKRHEFKWDDGTTFAFDEFPIVGGQYVACTFPDPDGGTHRYSYYIYISAEDMADLRMNPRYGNSGKPAAALSKADFDKMRVGVLQSGIPRMYPRGCYIPFKLNKNYNLEAQVEGLTGDYIFNKDTK
jgi:hypothetical protein